LPEAAEAVKAQPAVFLDHVSLELIEGNVVLASPSFRPPHSASVERPF